MLFIRRYFEGLSAPLFKTDALGRRLFFPAGVWSKGRIIPDAGMAEGLRAKVLNAYIAFFLIGVPMLVAVALLITGTGFGPVIAMATAAGLMFNAYLFSLARGLPISDERMTFGEAYSSQATAMGPRWIRALMITSAILAVGSALMLVIDRQTVWINLGGLVLFGACFLIFYSQLRGMTRHAG